MKFNEEDCSGCRELRCDIAGLKASMAEWFTILLQKFDNHDQTMNSLFMDVANGGVTFLQGAEEHSSQENGLGGGGTTTRCNESGNNSSAISEQRKLCNFRLEQLLSSRARKAGANVPRDPTGQDQTGADRSTPDESNDMSDENDSVHVNIPDSNQPVAIVNPEQSVDYARYYAIMREAIQPQQRASPGVLDLAPTRSPSEAPDSSGVCTDNDEEPASVPPRDMDVHVVESRSRVMRASPIAGSQRLEAKFVAWDNTCLKCGNKFRHRSNAFRHVKVMHLMDLKHKCPYCDKAFRWKEAIKRHMRAMHPENVRHLPEILAVFGAHEDESFDEVLSKARNGGQNHVGAAAASAFADGHNLGSMATSDSDTPATAEGILGITIYDHPAHAGFE